MQKMVFSTSILLLAGIMALFGTGCSFSGRGRSVQFYDTTDAQTGIRSNYWAYEVQSRKVLHGPFGLWYKNGHRYVEASYEHGELNGEFVLHNLDGTVEARGAYRHGKPWDGLLQVGHNMVSYSHGRAVATNAYDLPGR